MRRRALSGASVEEGERCLGEEPHDQAEDPDTPRSGRTHLRHMLIEKSVLDDSKSVKSTSTDDDDVARHLKRRQMKKDLHKLRRCMARTGVAAVAATMLTSPIEGVSSMDQASRFRRHRPVIPELTPDLILEDVEPDFETLAAGHLDSRFGVSGRSRSASAFTSISRIRSYRDSLLDDDGSLEHSLTLGPDIVSSGLTAGEWDRVSEMSEITTDGCQDWEATSIGGHDQGNTYDPDAQFYAVEDLSNTQVEFITCLDSISRFRRPSATATKQRDAHQQWWKTRHELAKGKDSEGHQDQSEDEILSVKGLKQDFSASEEVRFDQQEGEQPAIKILTSRLGGAASGVAATAQDAVSAAVASCRGGVQRLASLFGEPPQHARGNFTSLADLRAAVRQVTSGTPEERHHAKIFLACSIGLVVLMTLSCCTIILMLMAFLSSPDDPPHKEHRHEQTGFVDMAVRPKSISRVLTVVMISMFAGNGLAISHPMRDAVLAGI